MIQAACRLLSGLLGRVPSLVWAGLFLTCVPAFAVLYAAHRAEFYHATVQHEQGYLDGMRRVTDGVQQALAASAAKAGRGRPLVWGSLRLDPAGILVTAVRARGDALAVDLVLQVLDTADRTTRSDAGQMLLTDRYDLKREVNGQTLHAWLAAPGDGAALPVPLTAILPGDPAKPNARAALIEVPEPLHRDIAALLDGARGFPAADEALLPRMLYFSAVTITTLGYGDIVPISDRTRLLVGLEAVLGLILVGLFLNSLAHEREERTRHLERKRQEKAGR